MRLEINNFFELIKISHEFLTRARTFFYIGNQFLMAFEMLVKRQVNCLTSRQLELVCVCVQITSLVQTYCKVKVQNLKSNTHLCLCILS